MISELFLYPEERDPALIEAELARLGKTGELRDTLHAFLANPAAANAEEYVATLELSPPVPLYLGSYLYAEPESCRGAGLSGRNGYILELANIYRHFGVELDGRELADFVPVIVEFLGLSSEREDEDDIGLRRYFVETLLVNGIESLLSALRKYESPYATLVEALRLVLREDIARMAVRPKWQPPADLDRPPALTGGELATTRAAPDNWVEL